jgi:ADP-ribosylglycohydrolase
MKNSKIQGSLIGGAIGDALGYPFEFKKDFNKEDVLNSYKKNSVNYISDDTQMTLFTANGILYWATRGNMRGIAPSISDCVRMAYKCWYNTQVQNINFINQDICWISKIKELKIQRSPGVTCLQSLSNSDGGSLSLPINDSKGCGGIMRVAPIGLYFDSINGDIANVGKVGAETTAITHGHPLAIISSYVTSILISLLTYHNDISIEKALEEAMKIYEDNLSNNYPKKFNDDFIFLINKSVKLAHQDIDDKFAISELGEGWTAEETLAIAIYSCIKYSNNFENAILCAVTHDGDSDSTGEVAGNIIGSYLGIEKIPEELISRLELKDTIMEIADDLSIKCPVNQYSNNDTLEAINWLKKY